MVFPTRRTATLLWFVVIAAQSAALVIAPCSPDCSRFFLDGANNIIGTNVSDWDTSSVTSMRSMFQGATQFNQAIGHWDVSAVTDMSYMFFEASSFNQPVGHWNVGSVRDMGYMFSDATSFNRPIGEWDVSSVTSFHSTFSGTVSFDQPIGKWNVSKVTSMDSMFFRAAAFDQPIGNWSVHNVLDMQSLFAEASSFNQPIGSWKTSKVTTMRGLFRQASSFNQPIESWDTSSVVRMRDAFYKAGNFNQPLDRWNVSKVKDMSDMFSDARKFDHPIGSWDVSKVVNMSGMFFLTFFNRPLESWNVSSVTSMEKMFSFAFGFNRNLSCWCVIQVSNRLSFAYNSSLEIDNYPRWGTCPTNCSTAQAPQLRPFVPNQPPRESVTLSSSSNAIIGGVVGSLLAVVIFTAVAAFLVFRGNKRKRQQDLQLKVLSTEFNDMKSEHSILDKPIPLRELTIMQELGRGSWGTVSLATYRGQFVALKLCSQPSQDQTLALSSEAAVMSRMKESRNVVKFVGVCAESDQFGIVMEFCPKGSVSQLLRRPTPLSEFEAFKLVYGCLEGMVVLASAGVVHCDLAARNVLLDENQFAKVSDFGTARTMKSTTELALAGDKIGPYKWQAPEVCASAADTSEASDVWSFGCTLIEIMTRSEPYRGYNGNVLQLIRDVKDGGLNPMSHLEAVEPNTLSSFPSWVVPIIRSCFIADPTKRPSFKEIRLQLNRNARPMLRNYEAELDELDSVLPSSNHYVAVPQSQCAAVAQRKLGKGNDRELLLATSAAQESLPKIEQLGKLGEGSFGAVYLGRLQSQYVAIKVLSLTNPSAVDDVRREAGLMSMITPHKNVVQLHGIMKESDKLSIVLEFCPNGSLEDHVAAAKSKSTHLSEALYFKWTLGTCRGMAHLSSCKIVHRDLAARNILLDSTLEPKIADFGLGRAVLDPNQETSTQTDVGPVRWLAPECFDLKYSEKSDVWAFGATLIEMFTGKVPFPKKSIVEAFTAVSQQGRCPLDDVEEVLPAWLRSTLEQCFVRDAGKRPSFAVLTSFLEGQATSIDEVRVAEEAIQRRRNKRAGTVLN